MTSKHPLRRSCAFCRARKIKCSNEAICEACRRQGADCIYDFEPSRPKTRNLSQDSSKPTLSVYRTGDAPIGHTRQQSISAGSDATLPSTVMEVTPVQGEAGDSVAMALEQSFFENFFQDTDGQWGSQWQKRVAAYHPTLHASLYDRKSSPKNVRYTGILSLLTHDLVSIVTDQYGSLGCHHVEQGGPRFFLSGLASDDTQNMFDNPPLGSNPLAGYGQRQQTQLIDVWYSVHPLSFLVSKTLLLRELRDGTHDEILLATMLADANFSIGDDVSITRGHILLRWAIAQLPTRSLGPNQNPSCGGGDMSSGISTRIVSDIPTVQALVLLAWNALCSFQLRRAICYIGLARRMASEINDQISSTSTPVTSSRINGVDVFDVEKEIVAYLYWTTYSLSLWACTQMGKRLSALLPTSTTWVCLPVTETSSFMIQLDLVSENLSTLQKQKSVIREMWPLAHIARVVAYIFALSPNDSDTSESPTIGFWQAEPLLVLQQEKPSRDIASVCREVNRVLMESIHVLDRQVTEVSSRSFVLVVYHTMAIHFLFPEPRPMQLEEPITADVVERFCSSSEDILRLFAFTSEQPQDLFGLTPSLRGLFPDAFCMALDACARALISIHSRFNPNDPALIKVYKSRLQTLARGLYEISQNGFLNQGASVRLIRKKLKSGVRILCSSPASNSSEASSPDNPLIASMSGSPRRSPHGFPASGLDRLSTFSGIGIDLSSPYALAGDTSAMPSTMPSSSRSSTGSSNNSSFTPLEEVSKLQWQPDNVLLHDVLDTNALGAPTEEHISIADLVDLQSPWCSQMPTMMDFDMAGPIPVQCGQWDWSDPHAEAAAAGHGMDSVYYFFDRVNGKQHM